MVDKLCCRCFQARSHVAYRIGQRPHHRQRISIEAEAVVVELANIEVQRLCECRACRHFGHLGCTRQGMAGPVHRFRHHMRSVASATVAEEGSDDGQVRSRFGSINFRELRVKAW